MLDPEQSGLVENNPCNRADRAGNEQKTIGIACPLGEQPLRQGGGDRGTRKVVVREAGIAKVARDEHLLERSPAQQALAVGQVARLQPSVDTHLVVTLREGALLLVREVEAPRF